MEGGKVMTKHRLVFSFILLLVSQALLWGKIPSIKEKTASMEKWAGYIPFYWDANEGKIFLEIERLGTEFLYVNSLTGGLGEFETQLDRNRLEGTRIVRFNRIGPKLLLEQQNYSFRAESEDPDVRKAVEDAFAKSVLWGFSVEAEEDGRVLIDATSFFLRDATDIVGNLRRTVQSDYRLDLSRSAIFLPMTKNFPQNTEIDAMLTFASDNPGRLIRGVAPDPRSVTLRVHHSFCPLPDADYKPRVFDPRSGFEGIQYKDYASALGEPIIKRCIIRHRLQKKDPSARISEPVRPIVYYVERGIIEPVRTAIVEGASWWNEAFEAIGYRNAFRVEVLPEGVDPMDIRYNVISWGHRTSRGWSYASRTIDPRTGELIKSGVVLESQRVRQDYLYAEALVAEYEEGKEMPPSVREMALARLRQLACHEVGHDLGLDHNFASSANGRASAMDYPHPLVKIKDDGSLDLSDAYVKGLGEWDKAAIAYGYQDFPAGVGEEKELEKMLDNNAARGLLFLSNRDAISDGSAHPLAHRWDNGADPVAELERVMKIRSIALDNFSEK
jgi:hypothetical protein